MSTLRRPALLATIAWLLLSIGSDRGGAGEWSRVKPRPSVSVPAPIPIPVGSILSVTEPMIRQVVQRRDDNYGNIVFMGTVVGNVDGFQARSILNPGMSGLSQDWAPLIDVTITGQSFIGVYRQAAGGFYDLQIRPTFQGQVGTPSTIFAVGVGEVFITAGQSNSTNFGQKTGFIPDLRVSTFVDGTAYGIDPAYPGASWRWGTEPLPAIDLSAGGSAWPRMATNLVAATGVPVGLYCVACGGTTIDMWLPGVTKDTPNVPHVILIDRLINALNYFKLRGGVRAVLWDQGESDAGLNTDPLIYEANLRDLIELSRELSGLPVKWMVALATGAPDTNPTIRDGLEQAQVDVTDGESTFEGPNTDLLGFAYRQTPPAHFNAAGLLLLGDLWGIYVFNSPGFLAPGLLPTQ
jgi:hypothetical protein